MGEMVDAFKHEEQRIDIMNGDGDGDCKCILEYYQTTPESEPVESDSDRKGINQQPDDWLPITESRKGNSWTATFLLLGSGIGIQALSLPLALAYLGWFWGITCLSVAFVWQLYTIGVLVGLHESNSGTRYSRYLHLSMVAFGAKLGKLLSIFPVMYLSGGTCVMFIVTGGGTMKLFYQLMCGDCSSKDPLTSVEWFLVFTCLAIIVSVCCPNLHSVALISLLGAITAVGYYTVLWIVFVVNGKIDDTIYDPSKVVTSNTGRVRDVLNALGIIAISFRGHNVVLEIQGTMPSSPTQPSSKLMQKGVVASYLIISMCFFPVAIIGYWAYGNKILATGGMLTTLSTSIHHHASKSVLGLIYVLVVISCVTTFQIYSMVVYDNLERAYSSKKGKKCTKWTRMVIRILFGGLTFFISVAFPFLPSLALFIGGIALPLTFGYPCLMWIAINRSSIKTTRWWLNLGLGCLGIGLSVLLVVGALWNLVCRGLDANFFHPR